MRRLWMRRDGCVPVCSKESVTDARAIYCADTLQAAGSTAAHADAIDFAELAFAKVSKHCALRQFRRPRAGRHGSACSGCRRSRGKHCARQALRRRGGRRKRNVRAGVAAAGPT
jgi:hypothetical protein